MFVIIISEDILSLTIKKIAYEFGQSGTPVHVHMSPIIGNKVNRNNLAECLIRLYAAELYRDCSKNLQLRKSVYY